MSDPKLLNDCFDHKPIDLSCRELRRAYNASLAELSRHHGIICFSESWRSPVMWAHYANSHQGVCLGFDISKKIDIKKINYIKSQYKISIEEFYNLSPEEFCDILNSKHSDWAYERECRVFLNVAGLGDRLHPFQNDMKLEEVILGFRSQLRSSDIFGQLEKHGMSDVSIWTARASFKKFQMVVQRSKRKKK